VTDLTSWSGPGRGGLTDLLAWADHERRTSRLCAIAARTEAELQYANAVYDRALQYPDNPTAQRLLRRYLNT
jgi:hypothetical protein